MNAAANHPIAEYDHRAIAERALPEWTAAQTAVDALAGEFDRMAREGQRVPNRGAFIGMLAEMASALVYGDCCPGCHETRFPLRVAHLSADQAVARYECPCGRQWGCSWTRSLRVLGAMS